MRVVDGRPIRPTGTVRETFLAFLRRGEDERAAADLTAYVYGIPVSTEEGLLDWRWREVAVLDCLRVLVKAGRIGGRTDSPARPTTRSGRR